MIVAFPAVLMMLFWQEQNVKFSEKKNIHWSTEFVFN